MYYCLTYFLVKIHGKNFSLMDFSQRLKIPYELLENFSTDEYIEIGRNEYFNININVMLRESLKDLFGKEDILLELKEKYNLEYFLERVPIINNDDKPHQILGLERDIIEFMYKTKAIDDLDYHL